MPIEVPPTGGLPPRWADWWPWGARAPLLPAGISVGQLECSGTASFIVALQALHHLSARREVIIPAYTCPLVAFAIAHCGLTVRLCDLQHDSIDFDPGMLEKLCGEDTLAIVPTHLGGRVADVGASVTQAKRVGAFVIEDAAQAWGARCKGQSVGLQGDIGFFSMAVGKGITLYEGGLLVTHDEEMRPRLHAARRENVQRSWLREIQRIVQLLGYTALYRPAALGWSYGAPHRRALRQGDWVRAVGDDFDANIPRHPVSALRRRVGERSALRWPAYARALRRQALRRVDELERLPGVYVLKDRSGDEGAWPFLWLTLPTPSIRDAVLADLQNEPWGVTRLYIHALPDYAYLARALAPAEVPNARALAARSLTVSNSLWFDDALFDRVYERLDGVLSRFTPH
jgi:perosamine synthetase